MYAHAIIATFLVATTSALAIDGTVIPRANTCKISMALANDVTTLTVKDAGDKVIGSKTLPYLEFATKSASGGTIDVTSTLPNPVKVSLELNLFQLSFAYGSDSWKFGITNDDARCKHTSAGTFGHMTEDNTCTFAC
jgi:hypothetical protein